MAWYIPNAIDHIHMADIFLRLRVKLEMPATVFQVVGLINI